MLLASQRVSAGSTPTLPTCRSLATPGSFLSPCTQRTFLALHITPMCPMLGHRALLLLSKPGNLRCGVQDHFLSCLLFRPILSLGPSDCSTCHTSWFLPSPLVPNPSAPECVLPPRPDLFSLLSITESSHPCPSGETQAPEVGCSQRQDPIASSTLPREAYFILAPWGSRRGSKKSTFRKNICQFFKSTQFKENPKSHS